MTTAKVVGTEVDVGESETKSQIPKVGADGKKNLPGGRRPSLPREGAKGSRGKFHHKSGENRAILPQKSLAFHYEDAGRAIVPSCRRHKKGGRGTVWGR